VPGRTCALKMLNLVGGLSRGSSAGAVP